MKNMKHLTTVCRWTARLLGLLLVSVVVLIAVGQGIPNLFTQPVPVQLGFLALAFILGGILAGWRWELSGCLLSVSGWLLFVAVAVGSLNRLNGFVLAFALPGVLYLLSALTARAYITRMLHERNSKNLDKPRRKIYNLNNSVRF
jgi:hypothetical protein